MIDTEKKLSEPIQTKVTKAHAQQLQWLAETEGRRMADMVRILLLESLARWVSSAPGRRPRK
jgi:hypothetical protein